MTQPNYNTNLQFATAINRRWPGSKLKPESEGETRWGAFNNAFHNETHTPDSLLAEIAKGHSFTARLSGYRKSANFVESSTLALDYDKGNPSLADLLADPFIATHATFVYSTLSYAPDDRRWRVIFVMAEPITNGRAWREAQTALLCRFSHTDQSIKDACRFLYGSVPGTGIQHVLGNILPMTEVQALIKEHDERRRELNQSADGRALPQVDRSLLTGATPDEKYVEAALLQETQFLATRQKGTGERYAGVIPMALKLESLRLSEWLSPEARSFDTEAIVLGACHPNGLVAEYGEAHIRKAIEFGLMHADARERPANWTQQSANGHHPYIPEEPGETDYAPQGSSKLRATTGGEVALHLEEYHNTDYGNALRLYALYGQDLIYVPERGWHTWTGTHWKYDLDAATTWQTILGLPKALRERAIVLTKELDAKGGPVQGLEAAVNGETEDIKARIKAQGVITQLLREALKLEGESRLKSAASILSKLEGIHVSATQLNQGEFVFNTQNGTIDLMDNATLKEHNRLDYMTAVCPVRYVPTAVNHEWGAFLDRFQPDLEMQGFLQRAAGYTMTGSTEEKKIFFLYGTTDTGKSTFIKAIQSIMGDHACSLPFSSFLAKKYPDGDIPNDIAMLAGKRMVACTEAKSSSRMNEELLKQLSGGDLVPARFLHKEFFNFSSHCKIWMGANEQPAIKYTDVAMWERLLTVPFSHRVSDDEKELTAIDRLSTPAISGEGILAWMVQGFLNWRLIGLAPPAAVIQSTADYKSDQKDVYEDFLDAKCVLGDGTIIANDAFYGAFRSYVISATSIPPTKIPGSKTFTQRMRLDDRFEQEKNNARRWRGVGLKAVVEQN